MPGELFLKLVPVFVLGGLFFLLFRPGNHRWRKLLLRPAISAAVCGTLALYCAWFSTYLRQPLPLQHDEFAMLLAADTFASGRFTNPTPKFAEHFESFHILVWPSYASKYPPGQGLLLAFGQLTTGEPIHGSWLGFVWATLACLWCARAYLSQRWALLAGVLFACHPTLHFGGEFNWTSTFWGGSCGAIGGALVYGVAGRKRPSFSLGLILAVGLFALAISRPFEGFLVTLPALVRFLIRWWQSVNWQTKPFFSGLFIAGLPLFMLLGLYNYRVTGQPLRLPYVEHTRQYVKAPLFIWQQPREVPDYNHAIMREFHAEGWEWQSAASQRTFAGWSKAASEKWNRLWAFYGQPIFLGVLLAFLNIQHAGPRLLFWGIGLAGGGMLLSTWGHPHYFAPAAPLTVILAVSGIRSTVLFLKCRQLSQVVPLVQLLFFLSFSYSFLNLATVSPVDATAWHVRRARLQAELLAQPVPTLVLVTYKAGHRPEEEWVYNRADLENAHVIWAREMPDRSNEELKRYYKEKNFKVLQIEE